MQVMGNDRLKKSLTFLKCKFDIYPPTKEIFFFGLRMNFPFEFYHHIHIILHLFACVIVCLFVCFNNSMAASVIPFLICTIDGVCSQVGCGIFTFGEVSWLFHIPIAHAFFMEGFSAVETAEKQTLRRM